MFDQHGVEIAKEYDTPDWLQENAQRETDQAITALGEDGFACLRGERRHGRRHDRRAEGRGVDPPTRR